MKTATLNLQTLFLMSDTLATDFNEQLENAVADCKQRPTLSAKREVTLKLTITPHPEDPDDVLIDPVTSRKTPARRIEPIRARRGRRNQLMFDYMTEDDGMEAVG